MSRPLHLVLAAVIALILAGCGDDHPSTSVSLVAPSDGDTVAGAVPLVMTADGITIEEAGEVADDAGHFHVIADAGCLDAGESIGKDADHVHFGGGQSEGVVYLGPGEHELCLQVGDGVHSALDVTDTVSLSVAISDRDEWCSVVAELDELSEEVDRIEEFAAAQVGFENLSRLLAQLAAAIEFVDDAPESEIGGVTASPRGHVETSLAFASSVTGSFAAASDWDEAFAEVEALYAGAPGGNDDELPGGDWIEATCGVDLDD